MSRYIDVSNLDIPSDENDYDELVAFADKIAEMIVDAPSIDIEPKQGKWIDAEIRHEDGVLPIQVCSECKTFYPLEYTGGGHRFCPNCGADMRGKGDE